MNNVVLIGRLTKDAEVRYSGETPVARFTLAVDRNSRDKATDFIPIVVFGKQAENVERYLGKGRQCAVEGRIQTGSYEKSDGTKVYTTDVVAYRVEFLGSRNDAQTESSSAQANEYPNGFAAAEEDIPF